MRIGQSYDRAPTAELPLLDDAKEVLTAAGFGLSGKPDGAAGSIELAVRGVPLTALYQFWPRGGNPLPARAFYTGAEVHCVARVLVPGKPPHEERYSGKADPGDRVAEPLATYASPADAPWSKAFPVAARRKLLLQLISHGWGIGPLLKASAHPEMGREALDALGELDTPNAVDELLSALAHPSDAVRWTSARGLGRIGDARAVPGLIAALRDPSETVRQEAAKALGALGDPRALGPLEAVAKDGRFEYVQTYARIAIGRIRGSSVQRGTPGERER